ncbi:putative disease resistance protein [Ehrlichia ruminantium]|nr:putative disease resistance protein [Ehrlichia ruminantium]
MKAPKRIAIIDLILMLCDMYKLLPIKYTQRTMYNIDINLDKHINYQLIQNEIVYLAIFTHHQTQYQKSYDFNAKTQYITFHHSLRRIKRS